MESERKSEGLAEYAERWNGDVFEVIAYSGIALVGLNTIRRVLVIPSPFQEKSIVVMENRNRWKRKGKKRIRPLYAFLGKPGKTSMRRVNWREKKEKRRKIWISEKKFLEITERDPIIDQYAEQLFSKGRTRVENKFSVQT